MLGVSPALIEGYVAAAAKISRLALGDPSIGLDRVAYRVPGDLSQDAHVDGLPLGTRGGIVVRAHVPARCRVRPAGRRRGRRAVSAGRRRHGPRADDLYVAIDGARVALQGARRNAHPRAGRSAHDRRAPVVRSRTPGADGIFHVEARTPGITQVTIAAVQRDRPGRHAEPAAAADLHAGSAC